MFGIRLMFLLAVMGGVIAFIADKLGSKIGKKRLTVFGLRPHDTSVLLTVLSGVLISLFSVGIHPKAPGPLCSAWKNSRRN